MRSMFVDRDAPSGLRAEMVWFLRSIVRSCGALIDSEVSRRQPSPGTQEAKSTIAQIRVESSVAGDAASALLLAIPSAAKNDKAPIKCLIQRCIRVLAYKSQAPDCRGNAAETPMTAVACFDPADVSRLSERRRRPRLPLPCRHFRRSLLQRHPRRHRAPLLAWVWHRRVLAGARRETDRIHSAAQPIYGMHSDLDPAARGFGPWLDR
jgi:hypothetical protein